MIYEDAIEELARLANPLELFLAVTYDPKNPWFTPGMNFCYRIVTRDTDGGLLYLACAMQIGIEEMDFARMSWKPWEATDQASIWLTGDYVVMPLPELLEWNDWRFNNQNNNSVEDWRKYRKQYPKGGCFAATTL